MYSREILERHAQFLSEHDGSYWYASIKCWDDTGKCGVFGAGRSKSEAMDDLAKMFDRFPFKGRPSFQKPLASSSV